MEITDHFVKSAKISENSLAIRDVFVRLPRFVKSFKINGNNKLLGSGNTVPKRFENNAKFVEFCGFVQIDGIPTVEQMTVEQMTVEQI